MIVLVVGEPFEPADRLSNSMRLFRLETPETAARTLYDVLHECDALGPEAILVVMPPDILDWQAIRDRLRRATKPFTDSK
jgi:L-threonylcarbamoyladenylate synthase